MPQGYPHAPIPLPSPEHASAHPEVYGYIVPEPEHTEPECCQ